MSERTPIVDPVSTLSMGAALDEPVLLLNRLYAAVRIVSARRAFSLLCKQLAEVIAVEEEGMRTYDFADWCDIADVCLLYTSPSPRDSNLSRMPSAA